MRAHLRLAAAFTAAFVPGVAVAQHEAHQPAAPQAAAEMAQCMRVQPAVEKTIAAGMARLESARQTNSPAEMRAAIDHLDAAFRDIRAQLAPCSAVSAVADPHAGHAMPQPGEKQLDPVNGVTVDPSTAKTTTYQGQTYYFSSEQTLKEFLQNPAKFAKKPKG